MAAARAKSQDFSRTLQSVAQPLVLVDHERRIVFVNQACAAWLEVAAPDLQERVCRYQSSAAEPLESLADALCPPPEVFQGRKATGIVSRPLPDGTLEQRRADFVPLAGKDEESFLVLVVIDPTAISAADAQVAESGTATGDESQQLHQQLRQLRREMAQWHGVDRLVGQSPAMARIRAQVKVAAATTASVLIVGPAGIGKQHLARTIHFAAAQAPGAFTPVACAELSTEMLLSTIHSLVSRRAMPEDVAPSTLLLMDARRLPAEVQPELARLLSGAPKNVRVIATALESLDAPVAAGQFRADLASLLSTLVIELPPLASRRSDIPLVAQLLVEDWNSQSDKQLRGFTTEAMDCLCQHDWPGQIDELAGVVREACQQAESFEVSAVDLPKRMRLAADAARFASQPPQPIDLEKFLAQVETELIERAMRLAKGNKSRAAALLRLNRPRLYRRMVQLGLEPDSADPTDNE